MLTHLKSIIEGLHDRASVDTVYGDPVQANGRTIIPVAKVAYGFGGGYGSNSEMESNNDHDRGSDGGGFGGGTTSKPIGVIEVSDTGTQFVRPEDRRREIPIAIGCLLFGYLLGKYGE